MGVFGDFAMKYFEAGYSVIPIYKDEKKPKIDEWSKYCETMPTLLEIESWENEYSDCNIGVCLGKASGICAVDFDMTFGPCEEIENFLVGYLPPTPLVKKGKKGWTRFYKYNGEASKRWNKKSGETDQRMIDFLSHGLQTVVPPSIHPDTKEPYVWLLENAMDVNVIDLPSLPSGFYEVCEKLSGDDHKKILGMKEGRHDKIIAYGFAIIEKEQSIESFAEKLIEYDKRINKESQYFIDRKYFRKSQKENAMEVARKVEKSVARVFAKKRNVIGWKVGSDAPVVDIDMAIQLSPGFYDMEVDAKTSAVKLIPDYVGLGNVMQQNGVYKATNSGDYVFKSGHWQKISEKGKVNLVLNLNRMTSVPSHYKSFITELDSRCFGPNLENGKPGFINLENGVVDTNTWDIVPHSPKFGFKYKLPVTLEKSATCPTWLRFLDDVMESDKDRILLIQQMFGYVLLGGKPFLQKAFVLYGNGRNGKSVLLDILKAMLGRTAYSSISLKSFSERFETVMLDGKLCNISTDEGNDFKVSSGAFKLAVSGEDLLVQQKGESAYLIPINARFIFACNELPQFGDRSIALYDRLVIIPFNRMFLGLDRDFNIYDKLVVELNGILNWALDGARSLLTDGLIEPDKSVLSKSELMQGSDSLRNWIDENISYTNVSHFIPSRSLFSHYKACTKSDGHYPLAEASFLSAFRKIINDFYAMKNGGKVPEELLGQQDRQRVLSDGVSQRIRIVNGVSWSENKRTSLSNEIIL